MNENLERARILQERVDIFIKTGLLNEDNDLKKDWRTFSYILSTLPIKKLYHITTSETVQSIFECGSYMSIAEQSNEIIASQSPTLTLSQSPTLSLSQSPTLTTSQLHALKKRHNANLSLSFCPDIHILEELNQPKLNQPRGQAVLLTFDPIVALLKGTSFQHCEDQPNSDDTSRDFYTGDETIESLLKINFEAEAQSLSQCLQEQATQAQIKDNSSQYRNAKILVPNRVPCFLIKDIKLLSIVGNRFNHHPVLRDCFLS